MAVLHLGNSSRDLNGCGGVKRHVMHMLLVASFLSFSILYELGLVFLFSFLVLYPFYLLKHTGTAA